MRALLVVLADKVVHEKGFSRTAWPQHEFVSVRDDSLFHRQVGNIQMQRLSRQPVHHLDTEGRRRVPVVRFLGEEADRLLDERVETFLCRKIGGIAGNGSPEKRRRIDGVVAGLALHLCQLTSYLVPNPFQFLTVITPRHHVAMAAYRSQPETMRLVQILVDPLLVDLVGTAVPRKRVHILRHLLEFLQIGGTVVDKHILVINMVARQQQPDGSRKGQTAVAPVGR